MNNEEREKQIAANREAIAKLTQQVDSHNQSRNLDPLESLITDAKIPSVSHHYKLVECLGGHFGKIYALDWGNDLTTLLSAAQDGTLIVWNAKAKHKLHMINLKSSWVMSCAISDDNMIVCSGGLDNTCSVYRLPEGLEPIDQDADPHHALEEHTGYLSDTIFLDNNHLITSSGDATSILWDIKEQKTVRHFQGHNADITSLVKCGDNQFISGSVDKTAKIWDHRDSKASVLTFRGHTMDVNAVDMSRLGHTFVTAGDDSNIILHDLRSYGPLQRYSAAGDGRPITSCAFSRSSRIVFTGYDNALCLGWDMLTGVFEQLGSLNANYLRVSCLGVNVDGNALATGYWDSKLRIWA